MSVDAQKGDILYPMQHIHYSIHLLEALVAIGLFPGAGIQQTVYNNTAWHYIAPV